MYDRLSAGSFLVGFVFFFFYLAVTYGLASKMGKTPISKRIERRKKNIAFNLVVFLPVFALLFYIDKANISRFIIPSVFFVLVYEFAINRPRLNRYILEADNLYKTLKLSNQEEKYSFDANNSAILLDWDMPQYIKGNLYDVRLDRVCKNKHDEYFWVEASVKGFFEPKIKWLNKQSAKNLLRRDKEAYLKEFNEQPYI